MTGANGGAGRDILPGRRWDVALSFAGAQRDYVGAEELPAIHGEQAAAVVVFASVVRRARRPHNHGRAHIAESNRR